MPKPTQLLSRAVAALVVAVLVIPASATADPPVGGFLPIEDAIAFQQQFFPAQAPFLLRDRRATFFHPRLPITVNGCVRRSRPTVICRFDLKLIPNRRHRKANWSAVRCQGKVRSRHRTDGSKVGDVRNYRCANA